MSSTDNYSALSESKSKDDHRLKVLSEDGDGAQNYGAFSIETPPNDVVDVHGGNRKCGGRTRAWSKKKKVIVSLISAALLSFVAFVIAVIVELLLVQPQLNIAPSSLSMADSVHLQADASFPNPPRLSNVHISSTACKLYDSTGAYFATVSLENAKLASKFSLNARMDSVDISGFSRMMDQVLAARNAPKSDQSAIKAVCAASVTVSDAVFGASYSKDLSVTTSVRMQELWAAATDGTPVSGIDNFDWVDVQIPAGMRVEMAPFMYLANLQTPATDSTDVDSSNIERNFKDSRESESTSSESPLGCYALRSNSFSYTANLNDFRTAARELYTQWTNHLEYRREDCKDVCRNTNIATSQIGNDGVAVLSVCSPSNTFISNFLGDHHFSAQFATGSNLHLELTDTIEQHSSLGTLPSSYVSTYTAAHASLTTGSSTLGRVSVAPPEFVQALGVDATLIATYSYNVVSPQVATVLASVVLSAADPSSSGFSLTANADFNYLINIVSANQWAVNVSADFASNYSPSSGSSSTHYGGAVLAAGVLDSNAQSLKLSAALSFDANGQSFPFPTQYSADIFGQYSNVNSIIRVDTNGDVAWSGTQQTIFSGNFILNQNTQFGTLIFSEHPGGSASARTALFASSFYTLSTSPLVRFSLQNAVGTLTTNYSPRSIQEVSASLVAPLSVSGDWPFLLNLTIIERAPSDPAFRTRVLVNEAIRLQVALQAASTITFSNNGTIVANYQPITQYRAQFSVNTQKSVVQLAFYEGGPNDFPAVPTATPRTAYFLTSPLSYAFSSTSSPAINLSFTVNGAAQLIFSNAVQSVHTVSWTLTLQKDVLLMYNFYFFISAVERAGTDPATACRFCLHQTGKASIASSSNVFVNSASSISSTGDLSFQYNFLTAWSVTGLVDGKQQLAIVSFNEGGQNDYPYVPTAKPRTQFVTKPDLTYQYSSQPGVLTISATGAGQLTYSYSQVSQDSVTLAFSYVSSANTAVQLDFTFSDHFATDPSTVYRVLIDEHTSYNSAAADENDPDVSNVGITSRGTLIANYNVLSSYTLQFALNTQQSKVQTLAFYEGGVNDYPYVPSGTARTAYVITSPIIYSWSYTPSPLALNLNVNGAGQLTFSYAVQSVHSLSLTLNLGAQNSVATLYFFVSISERSGSDSVGSCRVCISDTTTATLPYSSDAYTQGTASLSSAGSMAINYNFLSAFQLNAAANGAQQIITLSFSEGGINDYPTVPSAPARTAYAFTPNVVYNLNTFTGGATFTITGYGQLTVNRNVLSVHSLQATFGYTNSPSGKLTIQLTEQAATDAPTVFRVQVDDSISFAWASPAAVASSSGTIIANYQYLTSYIVDAAADTKQQVVSFSFYEGGQNDFPAQPGQPPRTAYVLAPTQYTYSYSNSPLSLLIGASPSGQLTYGGALQSVHSATVSLSLQQDSQNIVHVQLTTNLAERSGSDKPGTCRECISHTSTASIPVSSSAFNSGITTLSSTGNVLIQYNFLSGFSLLALVDGSQNTVQVAFAEGGANDGPTQPSQPPRTAFNLNGTFNYSTSPIIISSDGSGNLTYSRAVQSIFQYSFLFDNADQVVRVSVTANSPSDPAIQHSVRTSLAALAPKEPLTVRVSLATTRDSYPIAYAETAVQMSCDAGSLAVHSNVQNIGSCGSGNWQSTIPNVLCHVNSERHTAAVSAVCEVTTMMALGNEIA